MRREGGEARQSVRLESIMEEEEEEEGGSPSLPRREENDFDPPATTTTVTLLVDPSWNLLLSTRHLAAVLLLLFGSRSSLPRLARSQQSRRVDPPNVIDPFDLPLPQPNLIAQEESLSKPPLIPHLLSPRPPPNPLLTANDSLDLLSLISLPRNPSFESRSQLPQLSDSATEALLQLFSTEEEEERRRRPSQDQTKRSCCGLSSRGGWERTRTRRSLGRGWVRRSG